LEVDEALGLVLGEAELFEDRGCGLKHLGVESVALGGLEGRVGVGRFGLGFGFVLLVGEKG
jgi:hypothetical protein